MEWINIKSLNENLNVKAAPLWPSNPLVDSKNHAFTNQIQGGVAQLVEYLLNMPRVLGSTPNLV